MDASAHGAVSSDMANMHNAEIFVTSPKISVKLPKKNNVRGAVKNVLADFFPLRGEWGTPPFR